MALFVLGLFVFGNSHGGLGHFNTTSHNLLAMEAITQPQLATYFASTHHSDNNNPLSSFGWTNTGGSSTTHGSMAQTNTLTP
jgi:hypothetical protein